MEDQWGQAERNPQQAEEEGIGSEAGGTSLLLSQEKKRWKEIQKWGGGAEERVS